MKPASLAPLAGCYADAGLSLPEIEEIDGGDMPEPYRTLLVHLNDMTPTLERHHGSLIHLRVLRSRVDGAHYHREVVLLLEGSEQAVEFGANRVALERFPADARDLILKEYVPLGTILARFNITHTCQPSAYFKLTADDLISAELGVPLGSRLYGRCNSVRATTGEVLSQVVEILPLL